MHERHHRRPGWTSGRAVILDDGSRWYFPRIDLALVITDPHLRTRTTQALRMALEVEGELSGSAPETIAMTLYHAHLAHVAVGLLRINYDLPEAEWKRLVSFAKLTDMFAFSETTSLAIADSAEVWVPLLTASDLGHRGVPSVN